MSKSKMVKKFNPKSEAGSLRSEMNTLKADISALREETRANFSKLLSKLDLLIAAAYRMQAFMEEQRAENRIMLDSYKQLWPKQEQIDKSMTRLKGF